MTPPIGGVLTTNVYLGVDLINTNCMNTAGHVWTVIDNTKSLSGDATLGMIFICSLREFMEVYSYFWSQLFKHCVKILNSGVASNQQQ